MSTEGPDGKPLPNGWQSWHHDHNFQSIVHLTDKKMPDLLPAEDFVKQGSLGLPSSGLDQLPTHGCVSTETGVWHLLPCKMFDSVDELATLIPEALADYKMGGIYWLQMAGEVEFGEESAERGKRAIYCITVAGGTMMQFSVFPFDIAGEEMFYGEVGYTSPPSQEVIDKIGGLPWLQPA